jgi:hypothetical protein
MATDADRFENLMEKIKGGNTRELQGACSDIARLWKEAPVSGLLSLKEQFHRLGLEEREAHLDAALIEVALRKPGPFTNVATEPGHPLWRAAVEVLSMVAAPEYLDLFISLLPLCPGKDLKELVRAIGCYDGPKVVGAVSPYLGSDDEGLFFEAVLALKRSGGAEAVGLLKECLAARRQGGSEMTTVLEGVIEEMAAAD